MIATRFGQFWDFVDKRQIDAHILSLAIFYGTIRMAEWSMEFAWTSTRPGMEVGVIIASITAPWSALQAAAIKFFFDARSTTFERKP